MDQDVKEIDQPFHVVTVAEKGFHSGHSTLEAAQSRCNAANESAIKQGLVGRYEVKNK
jgi:hypothetical protein